MPKEYKPKSELKVAGKMTPKGADIAGIIIATAAPISGVLFGVALILWGLLKPFG